VQSFLSDVHAEDGGKSTVKKAGRREKELAKSA